MRHSPTVIVRVRGGLGNQLFCYAIGRALSARNGVPLKLDATSAYRNDKFGRIYLLDRFNIRAELATLQESYQGFVGEWQRRAWVHLAKSVGPGRCPYILEREQLYDPSIIALRVTHPIYLDGYWQSERYFLDAEQTIRRDLLPMTAHSPDSEALATQMGNCKSVSVHLRSYAEVLGGQMQDALPIEYYQKALSVVKERVTSPRFFCFSDAPTWARTALSSLADVTFVTLNHGRGHEGALEDLWLMGQCRHHIIANSAFSWWGAWLNPSPDKVVIGPVVGRGGLRDWLPDTWIGL